RSRLADERAHPELLLHHILEVRHRSWAAIDRYRRVGTRQAVDRIEVASAGIAHDLDGELGLDRRPVGRPGRPGERYAEQPALEQQRMRRRIALWQVRAILAVDRGKDRVPASGNAPPFPDRFQREAHAV